MKLSKILASTKSRPCFIGFDTCTIEVLTGGKANPMQARVKKVMTGALAIVNTNYTNARNKHFINLGLSATFVAKPRTWGIYPMDGMPIITNKGKVYLNTSILRAGTVHYLLDDKPIDKAEITGLKVTTGITVDMAEVKRQQDAMTPEELKHHKAIVAANLSEFDGANRNPDSIDIDADVLTLAANNRKLYPRDYKAESITALRVNRKEYTTLDSANI